VAACAFALLLAATGCHQAGLYHAGSLPPDFVAPRVSSLHNVDFSRLARSVGNSDVLYPGDVVEVTIATGLEEDEPLSSKLRVTEQGVVNVPLVGSVPIAGLALTQAEEAIRAESIRRGAYVNPNVSVLLSSKKSNRVTIVGAVEEPGTYEIPASSSDVLAALVQAGGLTEDAGTVVEIRHPPTTRAPHPSGPDGVAMGGNANPQLASFQSNAPTTVSNRTLRIDLERATEDQAADLHLEDGSTVMVMKKPKRYIHVIGLVKKADQFEIPEDQELRLLDAIALAGGRTMEIADEVQIVRQVPGRQQPVVIEASISEAKRNGASNLRLAAGDVVSVEETPVTFVVGTIRDLMRFGFSTAIPMF
jgi:polysaccharide export outer membrane protein